MSNNRLLQQIQFIVEIDRLKTILRQTLITDGSRQENSAEHSWHIAMMGIVLSEYAPLNVDINQAIKMLLLHDLVEIDAGDTFCYDLQANQSKAAREQEAANRLFGMLPQEQGNELHSLWSEFEASETPTARWAKALDCLQPLLNNKCTGGHSWRLHKINKAQVIERMRSVEQGAPELWSMVQQIIEDCVAAGYLPAS